MPFENVIPLRMSRQELRDVGMLAGEEHVVKVLVQRGEMTGADRQFAAKYEVGDAVRVLHKAFELERAEPSELT